MKKINYAAFWLCFCVLLLSFPAAAQQPPSILTQPADISGKVGDTVALTCRASSPDGGTLKYAWYRCDSASGDGVGEELAPASADSGTYPVPTGSPGVFFYYCAVYNVHEEEAPITKSRIATVTITGSVTPALPVVLEDLEPSYSVVQNGTLLLSLVCAEQSSPVSLQYQWYQKNASTGAFDKIAGADANAYAVPTAVSGTYSFLCRISAVGGSTVMTSQSVIATVTVLAHTHAFGEWTVITPATCLTSGVEQRTCSCKTVEEREIEALGHDFGEWAISRVATSSKPGEERRTCSRCGISELRETDFAEQTTVRETSDTTKAPVTTADTDLEPDALTQADTEPQTTALPLEEAPDDTSGGQFPWWTVIILFGVTSTLGGGALAVWFFLRSRRLLQAAPEKGKPQKADQQEKTLISPRK